MLVVSSDGGIEADDDDDNDDDDDGDIPISPVSEPPDPGLLVIQHTCTNFISYRNQHVVQKSPLLL